MMIIHVDIFKSVFAFLKANPNVKPSAHLRNPTANAIPRHNETLLRIPIEIPSNTACMPTAICRMKGASGLIPGSS